MASDFDSSDPEIETMMRKRAIRQGRAHNAHAAGRRLTTDCFGEVVEVRAPRATNAAAHRYVYGPRRSPADDRALRSVFDRAVVSVDEFRAAHDRVAAVSKSFAETIAKAYDVPVGLLGPIGGNT